MKFKSKEQVHERAKGIINISRKELIKELNLNIKGDKNAMGDIFEAWFGKPKDSASEPDLGVAELKATPYVKLKNGNYSAKERLVLNIINYEELDKEKFETSHLLQKNKTMEIGFYEFDKNKKKDDWCFSNCLLYEIEKNKVDLQIIKEDWEKIQSFVRAGKAEEISESLTTYLAACTKGKNKHSLRSQPHSDKKAMQRAFSLKSSYMTTLLRKYVFKKEVSDSIIKDYKELDNQTIEQVIENRFAPYIGKSVNYLISKLNIDKRKDNRKGNYNVAIINKILGIKSEKNTEILADELSKASIIPKTVQFDYKQKNNESLRLVDFKFSNLVKQSWEDVDGNPEADLNIYLSESEFMLTVFQTDKKNRNYLRGVKFFKIPVNEKDHEIEEVWEDTKDTINEGVSLEYNVKTKQVKNNFIKISDNRIIHIRPHAGKSSYSKDANSDFLPTPAKWKNKPDNYECNRMTKQAFWLNSSYVKRVAKDVLK